MTKNCGVFVKINYSNDKSIKNSINHQAKKYRSNSSSKYVLCGGVYNKNGGTIIFHANNFQEAEHIINNNPFVECKDYSFEILSRNNISLVSC